MAARGKYGISLQVEDYGRVRNYKAKMFPQLIRNERKSRGESDISLVCNYVCYFGGPDLDWILVVQIGNAFITSPDKGLRCGDKKPV